MSLLDSLVNSIMTMEGANSPNSVNQRMIQDYGLYDPGHLIYAGQAGAVPVKIGNTTWAGFPTLDAGTQAIANQITLDASKGHTLESFISKYAPPSQNATSSYISTVAGWLGIDPSTKLSDILSGNVGSSLSTPSNDITANDIVSSSVSGSSDNTLVIVGLFAAVGLVYLVLS